MSPTGPGAPANPSALERWLDEHDITWVRTEGVTIDGVMIGKLVHRAKFTGALPAGTAISEIAYGMDLGGTPYLAWWPAWRRDALGDFLQRPDLSTLRPLPNAPGVAAVLVDHCGIDGDPLPVCPRARLRAMVERAGEHGFGVRAAFEIEGMLFTEPLDAARRRGFRGLTPMSHPAGIGYSIYNSHQQRAFVDEVLVRLDALGVAVEGWHDEAAPGQFECNLFPADAVSAADHVVRAKQVMREVALDLGCCVTFMAKPVDAYGNGLHVHHSLVDLGSGDPCLLDAHDALSEPGRSWLAGLVSTMPAATSIMTPTVNSFRRMVGWAAAPTTATWAEDNKSTGVRVLMRSARSARFEHRVASADANPYLVLATILAGGLAGLEHDLAPPPPLTHAGWGLPQEYEHLPNSITRAADAIGTNKLLREQLGDALVDYWVNTRRWEWLMYHTTGGDPVAGATTAWELDRYFEVM